MAQPPQLSATPKGALNTARVVNNLFIDGRAKHGLEGATIRMYLQMSLTIELLRNGGPSIQLFPEENGLRILTSAVHPLDSTGTPYMLPQGAHELLPKAIKTLQLPSPSNKSYLDTMSLSPTSTDSSFGFRRQSVSRTVALATSAGVAHTLDSSHTGSIQVSNYSVSFVLPKVWPRSFAESDSEEGPSRSTPLRASRRQSTGNSRKPFRFMAGMEIWIPYLSMPPASPYLLVIPVPKCLRNQLKLKIFPPPPPQASSGALTDEEVSRWDLTTEPPVQRKESAEASTGYGHLADDESVSDIGGQTATSSDWGGRIQGTFPSTERLRVRWAQPLIDSQFIPRDGWRRATVGKLESKTHYRIMDTIHDPTQSESIIGVKVKIEYTAVCRHICHPGAATRLALDVSLDCHNTVVSWADAAQGIAQLCWRVTGGPGLSGFDHSAGLAAPSLSRQTSTSSFESHLEMTAMSKVEGGGHTPSKHLSGIPVARVPASLLKVPLPLDGAADCSFEATAPSTRHPSWSSAVSSTRHPPARKGDPHGPLGPEAPLTLHLNLDDMLPPSRHEGSSLSFQVEGEVIIRPGGHTDGMNTAPADAWLPPPIFRVHPTNEESTEVLVSSFIPNVQLSTAEPVTEGNGPPGALKRSRKLLRIGTVASCHPDVMIQVQTVHAAANTPARQPSTFSSLGTYPSSALASQPPGSSELKLQMPQVHVPGLEKRTYSEVPTEPGTGIRSSFSAAVSGPQMVPWVHATVIPTTWSPSSYVVQIRVPFAGLSGRTLEFGLKLLRTKAAHDSPERRSANNPHMRVELVSASVGGRSVDCEVFAGVPEEPGAIAASQLDVQADEKGGLTSNGSLFVGYMRVDLAQASGSTSEVEVVYMVGRAIQEATVKTAGRQDQMCNYSPVLPSFHSAIGRYTIAVENSADRRISSLTSNLPNQVVKLSSSNASLTAFAVPASFTAHVSIKSWRPSMTKNMLKLALMWLPLLISVFVLGLMLDHRTASLALRSDATVAPWSTEQVDGHSTHAKPLRDYASTASVPPSSFKLPFDESRRRETAQDPTGSDNIRPTGSGLWNSFTNKIVNSLTLAPLPPIDFEATVDMIVLTLNKMWDLIQRIFHYPAKP